MGYTIERTLKVYSDDASGDYVSVGSDGDGLDLVELRQSETDARILLTREQAEAFVLAIKEYLASTRPSD